MSDLFNKRIACLAAIQICQQAEGDPRSEDALKHYQKQLAEIDAAIAEAGLEPPPIVIGLQTAQLFGKAGD